MNDTTTKVVIVGPKTEVKKLYKLLETWISTNNDWTIANIKENANLIATIKDKTEILNSIKYEEYTRSTNDNKLTTAKLKLTIKYTYTAVIDVWLKLRNKYAPNSEVYYLAYGPEEFKSNDWTGNYFKYDFQN